ncbi:MAG TPA: hypothetical protein VM325_08970 [Alphaproteobacteria bacterium]|nr:hypothetical protein [Alphaproteobacteria bacterium]
MKSLLVEVGGIGRITVKSTVNSEEAQWPEIVCVPPHTAYSPKIVTLDRGENFHGALTEDFYACSGYGSDGEEGWGTSRSESGYWTLWMGENGSQYDDDQARLFPVAFCLTEEVTRNHEIDERPIAPLVLLYGWIRLVKEQRLYGDADWYNEETEVEPGGTQYVEATAVLQAVADALKGNPLSVDFSLLLATGNEETGHELQSRIDGAQMASLALRTSLEANREWRRKNDLPVIDKVKMVKVPPKETKPASKASQSKAPLTREEQRRRAKWHF